LLSKLAINLPGFGWLKIAHISLTFVGFMWVLPFQYYYHAYPLITFYSEWGAAMLALNGRQDEAKLQIERAIWAYPGDFPVELQGLITRAQKDPVHFSALLEFAVQKYEEYASAVSTK